MTPARSKIVARFESDPGIQILSEERGVDLWIIRPTLAWAVVHGYRRSDLGRFYCRYSDQAFALERDATGFKEVAFPNALPKAAFTVILKPQDDA